MKQILQSLLKAPNLPDVCSVMMIVCLGTDTVYVLSGERTVPRRKTIQESLNDLDSAAVYTQVVREAARRTAYNWWNGGTDFQSYFGYKPLQGNYR